MDAIRTGVGRLDEEHLKIRTTLQMMKKNIYPSPRLEDNRRQRQQALKNPVKSEILNGPVMRLNILYKLKKVLQKRWH
jgi:hypothetical protein